MSRLDDAIGALRTAAGDRPFVLVLDRRAATATTQFIEVITTENVATYVVRGLLLEASGLLDAKYPFVIDSDDEDDPATE
jgi:hypothetical protein